MSLKREKYKRDLLLFLGSSAIIFGAYWVLICQNTCLSAIRSKMINGTGAITKLIWGYLFSHPCEECGMLNPIILEFHRCGLFSN
jgi:hypothetical protein